MADIYTLHFDGSCGPKNPGGTAAYGFTLSRFGDRIASGHAVIGSGPGMTNNVAEYAGLYEGMAALAEVHHDGFASLNVRGDSKLVINQMSDVWKARNGLYMDNYKRCRGLAADLRRRGVRITFEWIPRDRNQECDDLSKEHIA